MGEVEGGGDWEGLGEVGEGDDWVGRGEVGEGSGVEEYEISLQLLTLVILRARVETVCWIRKSAIQ